MILTGLFVIAALGHASAITVVCRNGENLHFRLRSETFVVSDGYDNAEKYPNSYLCAVTLTAPSRAQRVRIDFEDFDVESSIQCRNDRLDIYEVYRRNPFLVGAYCSAARPKPYLSRTNTVIVRFKSNKLRSGRGFRIRATPTGAQSVCEDDEFQCDDRTCLPASKRCDGVYDCHDASDEYSCAIRPALKSAECGRPAVQPEQASNDRVVGGQEAVPHSWPWQVSFQVANSEPLDHFCGGTIITNQWIVSAAHCFAQFTRTHQVIIKAGLHDMLNTAEEIQTRKPEIIIWHQNFLRGFNLNYDIAVVKVSVPFNFTDTVRPACLPVDEAPPPVNTTCFSTGWGHTRGSGNAFRLKQTRLNVEDFEHCRHGREGLISQIGVDGGNSVCARSLDNIAGPCHGDSGGPLVCSNEDEEWTLYGATSLGVDTTIVGSICGMGDATLWSSVGSHRDWIMEQLINY